ncbi:hypothetical protein [Streptomyces sp. CBMA156]|uniref:hypothetical protein n=1 Tax=Streptomyces sp. CBMA156 TaxID=1930280 RepID=UPI001661BB61|nr:hypothetical protein [Streptomyces sp. CBMA156]MBD0669767.1 hypothetical protein [Streptomyces sp. CBMA156]
MKRISTTARLLGTTTLTCTLLLLGTALGNAAADAGGASTAPPYTVLADTSWGGLAPCGPACDK